MPFIRKKFHFVSDYGIEIERCSSITYTSIYNTLTGHMNSLLSIRVELLLINLLFSNCLLYCSVLFPSRVVLFLFLIPANTRHLPNVVLMLG